MPERTRKTPPPLPHWARRLPDSGKRVRPLERPEGMPDPDKELALSIWLKTATDGLCLPAVLRVHKEVYAHYLEGVEDAMEEGHTEEEARRMALEGLGDSRKARRAFRRAYLTEVEAKQFGRMAGNHGAWGPKQSPKKWSKGPNTVVFALALCVLAFDVLMRVLGDSPGAVLKFPHAVMALILVTFAVRLWVMPPLIHERKWRRVFGWSVLSQTLSFAGLGYVFVAGVVETDGQIGASFVIMGAVTLPAMAIVSLIWIVRGLSALRKLGKSGELYESFLSGDDEGGRCA